MFKLAAAISPITFMVAFSTGGSPALAQPIHDFTLQQVLSAPFPSGMVAAPSSGRVAWVFNDRGARNIWVRDRAAGGNAARAITSYTGDDGTDLGDLAWDPAGSRVFYTRGGSIEGGPPVNALSLRAGAPTQSVFVAGLEGQAPRRIGPGHLPTVSPRGDRVAWLLDGQIWISPISNGAPSQAAHDRGEDGELIWSPDGGRLAFVSSRSGHSFVGVLDFATDAIRWMAPGFDRDIAPEWSPDGKRVAFVRVPAGETEADFTTHRQGQPWSIWICDANTGLGRAAWVASPGKGSVFEPLVGSASLRWAAGDQMVFPWERTGWEHLYAVPSAGGVAREVTTGGAFEVFNTALSPDRSRIIYSANGGDIDRWHLWSVPAAGGAPRQLTRAPGIEDYPVIASDGAMFALHGDGRAPLRPVTVAEDGTLADLAPGTLPGDFPTARLVEPKTITFDAPDGLTVHGQLFLPLHQTVGRAPAILFFHGGPVRQMLPAWHPMDAYSFMYGFNQYLANEGYVVLSVNYRGGIGYGLDFRQPERFGAGGASEYNDVLGGAHYLASMPGVDAKRIGIWGGSYGGLMTALGLSRASNLFAAGVDYAGVHDWRAMLPELSAPGAPPGTADLAYASSAIATVRQWRSPVLIAHNDDDRNVAFAQSIELVEALRKQGVPTEELILPDEVHSMLRQQSWLMFFTAADDFFGRTLRGGEAGQGRR